MQFTTLMQPLFGATACATGAPTPAAPFRRAKEEGEKVCNRALPLNAIVLHEPAPASVTRANMRARACEWARGGSAPVPPREYVCNLCIREFETPSGTLAPWRDGCAGRQLAAPSLSRSMSRALDRIKGFSFSRFRGESESARAAASVKVNKVVLVVVRRVGIGCETDDARSLELACERSGKGGRCSQHTLCVLHPLVRGRT